MIRITNLRLLAATVPLLAAVYFVSPSTGERIRFAPAEGSSLAKTFDSKVSLALDDYQIEGAAAAAPPKMEQTFVMSQRVGVTDEYTKNGDGAPLVLKRRFDEISSDRTMTLNQTLMGQTHPNEQNMHGKSELAGKKVVYTWDADKKAYKKAFEPTIDKDDLLAGLHEDMDLRCFLPAGEVKEGESWDVDVKGLVATLAPGGNLAIVSDRADAKSIAVGAQVSATMSDMIGEKIEGAAKAKLVGIVDDNGTRLAKIELDIRIHSANDMTDTVRKVMESIDLPPSIESLEILSLKVDYSLESEGELVWDLTAGHFRSLELSGTTSVKSDQKAMIGVAGRKIDVRETREMSGTSSLGAKAQ